MNKISHIKFPHSIEIGVSPKDYDLSVTSIDDQGNSGRLNSYVLAELEYKNKSLPDEKELQNGFYLLQGNYRKSVLFIVTVGENYTQSLLKKNLLNGLQSNYNLLIEKNIWLPLLGTGTGNLSLFESLSITTQVLNEFADTITNNTLPVHFTIALPNTLEAEELLKNRHLNVESRENNEKIPFEELHENIESSENKKSIYYQLEQGLKTFNGKYFLAGSVWSNNIDQAARFYEDNIWENGYEERYIEVVKSANPGDIIFLKSTYTRNKISYLRIKGIGIILSNPNTGIELKVNWIVKNIQVNLPNLGKYRSTILIIENNNDLWVIIKAITGETGSNIYDNLRAIIGAAIGKPSSNAHTSITNEVDYRHQITNRSTIAGLNSDSEVKEDFLDIKKDIQAFSKIMASKSFKPPLAIALLGKWGSGKSFFMNQLKDNISILANRHSLLYCKGIAQIHFNAWSYLDANLWASIVTKIFEGLNEYITKDTKANKLKEQIEKELSYKLTITKEEIQLLEKQKKTVEQQLLSLDKQSEKLKIQLSADIDSIENNTLINALIKIDKEFQLYERIRDTLQNSPTWKITESEFKKLIPEEYWENPNILYQQIQSKYTFLREFFNWKNIGRSTLCGLVILVLIVIIPSLIELFTGYLANINFTLPQISLSFLLTVGVILRHATSTYKRLQPLAASFWKIREDYEKEVARVSSEFDQKEKALRLRIEESRSELATVNQQIQQAQAVKINLESRINNTIATEALYSFIEKRTNSEDYRKHLGIVSMIRKDFEILSSLFLEHTREAGGEQDIRSKFDCPLERIILYIDDLDRCPEDRVVEVLEAVNLLMAFPLFIVVVGVDPRWVKNALIKKHYLQFKDQLSSNKVSEQIEVIEPSHYLEKIFQVAFHLREADENNVKYMLKTLSEPKRDKSSNIKQDENKMQLATTESSQQYDSSWQGETNPSFPQLEADNEQVYQNTDTRTSDISDYLVLSNNEVISIQDFARVIGNNPRSIKRFVNVYQIVRAHEDLRYSSQNGDKEFLVLMFLLSLPIGPFKRLTSAFRDFITNPLNEKKPLSTFLDQKYQIDSIALDELKNQFSTVISDNNTFALLRDEQAATYLTHNKFIQRFTFEEF